MSRTGTSARLARSLAVILEELGQPRVCQRMLEELFDDLERHGGAVGAGKRGLNDVHRTTDARGEHLRVVVVVFVDRDDLLHDIHAFGRSVVDAPHERGNVCGSRLGREKRLRRAEAERDVGADPFLAQRLPAAQEAVDEKAP